MPGSTTSTRVTVDDGVALATVAAGDPEDPGLLLVPGFGGAKEDFADHIGVLARTHRVVSFDHRGHGDSDKPDDPRAYSLDRLGADVRAVADAFELHELRLLGHSMGGMAVRRAILHDLGRVRAVVFMNTSAGAPPAIDPDLARLGAVIARTEGMAVLKQVQDELDPLGSPAYRRVLAERPGFLEYARRKWASLSPVMWSSLAVEITTQPSELDRLAAIGVPTLVIVGEEDNAFLEPSRDIAATVPGADLVVIPTAGHSPQFENPTAWRSALEAFLARLGAFLG